MEPNNSSNNTGKQRTREEITRLLRDYENSKGISVQEYSKMIGVSDATFYNWRKKYGQAQKQQADFIPLEITGIQQLSASVQAEVKVIKLYGPLSIEQLKALLS